MVVITYCVEYAQSQKSVCLKCNKIIPNKSLRVPEIMTKIPVHFIRGQANLLDKDKLRLERVIKLGVGASWSQIVDQHKKKVKEEEEAAEAEALENGTPLPAKKPSKDDLMDSDDDETNVKDFTSQLTGEVDRKQERKNRKANKLKAKTDGAKVAKKQQQQQQKPSSGAASNTKGKSQNTNKDTKPMSAVAKAIAASRADSQKKMEQMKSKFGKK
ncbi:hypothetical protein FBU30_004188 [Linnemannia zychae]|nr:hypothetical protein FBU30_004188 [Linnemannia zychae]